ncbi:hypothetical protein FHS27_001577 [Rhodopirellula rubra]|uniref:Uncharacterized protein n=1 Tax=Aporhodopirellula rubra TaxID=980271 RepID=A0A7W5DWF6_9BACT|nr:hypothetical protein [Aporhodopirellula rubra]
MGESRVEGGSAGGRNMAASCEKNGGRCSVKRKLRQIVSILGGRSTVAAGISA